LYTRFIIGNTIHRLVSVNSTNSYAKEFANINKSVEGFVIIADEQTKGRGQYGNKWDSEAKKNLTFSIILCPKFLKVSEQFLLSQAIALGVATYLRSKTNQNIFIKWPNDVLIENAKVCGMLIESALQGNNISESIVGIGLNINQTDFAETPNATSLAKATQEFYDLHAELELLLNAIDKFYLLLMQGRHHFIREQYNQYLFRKNEPAWFMLNNEKVNGIIQGVNVAGQLEITINETLHRFNNKEIAFVY
jgi:BirA family biotin operon repressor/biotin-[acetyl-CoA-carboxylase] ligase